MAFNLTISQKLTIAPFQTSVNVKSISSMGFLPNRRPKCTWSKFADPATSPHTRRDWERDCCKIYPNVLTAIGNTPLVKLNNIPKSLGLNCEVYAKCEFLNPCCSVKDRIALRAILDAEDSGLLTPETTLIEPSTGNTAVAFAMVASIKGYRCIVVMPEKTSPEKTNLVKALGAEVVLCPNVGLESEESIFGQTHNLLKQIEDSVNLDQFSNAGNPLAHYDQTAEEILNALDNELDMVVAGCGTGGTLSGIGRKLKEVNPNIEIVGADPEYSELARPAYLNKSSAENSEIEGIGFKIMTPTTLDRSVIDRWIKVSDKESFVMARRLMREEGLFCGGTGGTALLAAAHAAKDLKADQKVVVILPDAIRYYFGRYALDSWMQIRQYELCVNTSLHWWWNIHLNELIMTDPQKLRPCISCHRALHEIVKNEVNQLPVVNEENHLIGVVSKKRLMLKLIYERVAPDDPVEKAMVICDIPKVQDNVNLGVVSKVFELGDYCIVYKKTIQKEGRKIIEVPIGMITPFEVVHYLANHPHTVKNGSL